MFLKNTKSLKNSEIPILWKSVKKKMKKMNKSHIKDLVYLSQNLRMMKRGKKTEDAFNITDFMLDELEMTHVKDFYEMSKSVIKPTRSIKKQREQLDVIFHNISILGNHIREDLL